MFEGRVHALLIMLHTIRPNKAAGCAAAYAGGQLVARVIRAHVRANAAVDDWAVSLARRMLHRVTILSG